MKKLLPIAILFALGAAAQDPMDVAKLKAEKDGLAAQIQLKMVGAVAGTVVKGAPYSGEELNQTDQMLADGTRIHRETRATVYRDSEGRTRRETPDSIIISDPVAGVTYMLNPKSMTGSKLNMPHAGFAYLRQDKVDAVKTFSWDTEPTVFKGTTFSVHTSSEGGPPTVTVNGQTLDPKTVEKLIAEAKANGSHTVTVNGAMLDAGMLAGEAKPAMEQFTKIARPPKGEPLGKQMVEGVEAEGTRNVTTIETGTIGNDRPIQVTGERWYSSELQTLVMSKHSDPRTGDETFRLTNIQRGDPAVYLFQVPSGYTITDRK
ncbi:MAG TPA: hypothetical protein VMJ75_01005 [Candidatus Acidoferrales bacterium]|nr:hypothetical protein [Candidatus Acidoferrales bacterium]